MKIEKFSVFKITDDEELIEKVLGDDDVPYPGSRFLVVESDKESVEAILEDFNGKFDLSEDRAYFPIEDFEKIAKYESTIGRGKVNTF